MYLCLRSDHLLDGGYFFSARLKSDSESEGVVFVCLSVFPGSAETCLLS